MADKDNRNIDKDNRELYTYALLTYGEQFQINMMVEECSELIKAIMKLGRTSVGGIDDGKARWAVREELADVQIMLDQMKIVFGETDEIEQKKLERLADRMGYPEKAMQGEQMGLADINADGSE